MGTRAGYITVDWEKVDQDMRQAGEHINQKIVEHQRNEETQDLIQKVSLILFIGYFSKKICCHMMATNCWNC